MAARGKMYLRIHFRCLLILKKDTTNKSDEENAFFDVALHEMLGIPCRPTLIADERREVGHMLKGAPPDNWGLSACFVLTFIRVCFRAWVYER